MSPVGVTMQIQMLSDKRTKKGVLQLYKSLLADCELDAPYPRVASTTIYWLLKDVRKRLLELGYSEQDLQLIESE